ncbi:MAG: hypothetical protein ACXWJH_04070 [Hyphomicrobium sp.]
MPGKVAYVRGMPEAEQHLTPEAGGGKEDDDGENERESQDNGRAVIGF